MDTDRVTLTVPAKSEYARAVRMTAAALVSRMGMSYDDVEDVRIAAEEAFIYACETLPDGSDVRFELSVGDDEFGIDVTVGDEDAGGDEDAEHREAYAAFILESVSDFFEFSSREGGTWLRLVKRVGEGDGDQE